MVALLITGLFCVAVMIGTRYIFDRWLKDLNVQEAYGLAGIIGLGLVGTLTVALGLIPGFLRPALYIVGALVAVLALLGAKKFGAEVFQCKVPKGMGLFGIVLFVVLMLVPVIASQVPSTVFDWDSLAYHLAVPKIWLNEGEITYVQTIHHSNFPFALDALYLFGLSWAGEYGAKAFMVFVTLFGARALYGLSSRLGAGEYSIFSSLAFVSCPVVLWESGTAYIDAGHGLYAGLGVLYTAQIVKQLRENVDVGSLPVVASLCWGLALGTKLTGLQTFIVAGLLYMIFGRKQLGLVLKPALLVTGLALSVSGLWFVKSALYTGNPVFPFFYEQLGGRGWDQWRADIYKNEQQTFGVGRKTNAPAADSSGEDTTKHASVREISMIGHAVLGLTYQPGKYVNPGQDSGQGFPIGAIGFLALFAYAFWAVMGKLGVAEKYILSWVGLTFLIWFFLSQQSRYLTFLVVPSAVMLAYGVAKIKAGRVLVFSCITQALVSLYVIFNFGFSDQLKVVTNSISPEAYRNQRVNFAPMAEIINNNDEVTEVALFDEVFGFLLDKKYFWANPGHSDKIPFEKFTTSDEFVESLKEQKVSHVYMAMLFADPEARNRWFAYAGLIPGETLTSEEINSMRGNREVSWKIFIADAIRSGQLSVASTPLNPRGILLKVE